MDVLGQMWGYDACGSQGVMTPAEDMERHGKIIYFILNLKNREGVI